LRELEGFTPLQRSLKLIKKRSYKVKERKKQNIKGSIKRPKGNKKE